MKFPRPANFRKLPILGTIKRTYEIICHNFGLMLAQSWIPLVAFAIASALPLRFLQVHPEVAPVEIFQAMGSGGQLSYFLCIILGALFVSVLFVSWQRHLLLQERLNQFAFSKAFWGCMGVMTLVLISGMGLGLLITLPATTDAIIGRVAPFFGEKNGLLYYTLILLAIFSLVVTIWSIWHSLIITAAAVENKALTWREGRAKLNGNLLRYCFVTLLIFIPIGIGETVVQWGVTYFFGVRMITIVLLSLLQGFVIVLETFLGASLASLAYDFFVRGGGPEPARVLDIQV